MQLITTFNSDSLNGVYMLYVLRPMGISLKNTYYYLYTGDLLILNGNFPIKLDHDQTKWILIELHSTYIEEFLLKHTYHLFIFQDFFKLSNNQQEFLLFRQTNLCPYILDLEQQLLHFDNSYSKSIAAHQIIIILNILHQNHQNTLSINESTMMRQYLAGSILKYLHDHLTTATLNEAAQFFGYHPAYFSKLFKQLINDSFANKLRLLLLSEAELLLKNSILSIKEIANKVGYQDTNHFYVLFKQRNGITPLQYRKQYSLKNNILNHP